MDSEPASSRSEGHHQPSFHSPSRKLRINVTELTNTNSLLGSKFVDQATDIQKGHKTITVKIGFGLKYVV